MHFLSPFLLLISPPPGAKMGQLGLKAILQNQTTLFIQLNIVQEGVQFYRSTVTQAPCNLWMTRKYSAVGA